MGRLINATWVQYLQRISTARRTRTGVRVAVDDEWLRVDVLRPDLVRIQISQGGRFDASPTHAVVGRPGPPPPFTCRVADDAITVATAAMRVCVRRAPFALDAYRADGSAVFESYRTPAGESQAYGVHNNRFVVTRRRAPQDAFLGLGEKTRAFNRAGHDYLLWNTDIFGPAALSPELGDLPKDDPARDPKSTVFDPYYISIPFFYHLPVDRSPAAMAGFFVDNGYRGAFEFSGADCYRYQFTGGQYTEYVFAGPDMKSILAGYTALTGTMAAPPLWALGYHQCRWYPYTQETLLALAARFRERDIPCDVLWLDIDYMDGYRVFTWNRKTFPDPDAMLKTLRERGFRAITIIDPGVKIDPGYPVFDDGLRRGVFCLTDSGRVYRGAVWPGSSAFPNFADPKARRWWGRLNAAHVKSGLAGIWNDMNEPVTFTGEPTDMRFDHGGRSFPHERFHNQYALLMAMGTTEGLRAAMPQRRTFVLSRAGSPGIQRYAANWMGDNCSRWEHLAMSIPMALGLGVSGQPFVGCDAGGFAEAARPELLVRWMQYAALTPFFRNHNCDKKDQYPWSFGPAEEALCREAIRLRYRLLPYLYSTFMAATETGAPIQRPLVYDFQSDPATLYLDDQYLLGEALLVAPVCAPGVTRRRVYLPEGTWYDWHTGTRRVGPRYVTAEAPLDYIPLLARGGHVIPALETAPASTAGLRPESVDLHVFVPQADGAWRSLLHEDDGLTFAYREGACYRTAFDLERSGERIVLRGRVTGNGYPEFARRRFRVVFHGLAADAVAVDGERTPLRDGACAVEGGARDFTLEAG
jgi:alpha-glucosidase